MTQYNRGAQIAAQLLRDAPIQQHSNFNLADAIDSFTTAADWAQHYQNNQNVASLQKQYGQAVQDGNNDLQQAIAAQLDPIGYQRNQLLKDKMQQEQQNWQQKFAADNKYNETLLEFERLQRNKQQAEQNNNLAITQQGINTLADIANNGRIGNWTRFRNNFNLASDAQERDLGSVSSAIAAIAPMAIQRLKNAGVSGVNTLGEFMTYVGLPESPTSEQIKGALPIISQIVGVQNPLNTSEQQPSVVSSINNPLKQAFSNWQNHLQNKPNSKQHKIGNFIVEEV